MLEVFRESFDGKYDGVTPPSLLQPGDIADGKNIRKVSRKGGWKVRKGCTLHNTTAAESGASFKSLHYYKNPRNSDYHFIGQVNSKLLDATNDPPASGATFGTDLGVSVGTTPGFSCTVGETFVYADGSGTPVVYGGDNPYCSGFLVWDNSESAYIDYTRWTTDGRSTVAVIGNAASDVYYVGSPEIADGIVLDLVNVNTTDATTVKVYSWVSGAWSERVTGFSDGTLAGGTHTHGQDGTISWTRNSSDSMRVLGGIMAYWYKVEPQLPLTDGVTVQKCQVTFDTTTLTNKWNGVYEWLAGVRFFVAASGEYVEALGKLSNESTGQYLDLSAATTSDYLYIKTFEPATGIGLGIVDGYGNTAAAVIDSVEYWNGNAWTACSLQTDGTKDSAGDSSFSRTGVVFWNGAADSPAKRTFQGDEVPGYWYRLSWDVALSADVRIYLGLYIPFPESLPTYDGCLESKGRLILWGDPEFPNRFRASSYRKHDCFSGSDSGYSPEIGNQEKILCCLNFYNEILVFKESSVYLVEGDGPLNYKPLLIASGVGLASPKSAIVVEVGSPGMEKEEVVSVAIWQDVDGIYMFDGRKPRKISDAVAHYFDTEYSTAIASGSIANRQAFPDPLRNEYHFLLPSGELVYNYATDEWYPPWEREIDLVCGLSLKGTDGRFYTYGASGDGFVLRLENDTTDKDTANADVAISHSIKTRAMFPQSSVGGRFDFNLRKIWAELKARSSGSITTKTFADSATSGTIQATPQAMSMVNSGKSMALPGLSLSETRIANFQVEFSLVTADAEMEIWSTYYQVEVVGELGTT